MKKRVVSTIVVFVLIIATAFGFMLEKKGLFLDEIYSYGLSNSHYAPFLSTIFDDGFVDKTFTSSDFNHYLTVQDGELFDVESVFYNQAHDVHPPLYYLLLNAVSSFTPNSFSIWTGLLLGLPIWLLTGLLLYRLAKRITGKWELALLAVALWTLSQAGISSLLMIRMYVLLTLMSVLLGNLLERIIAGSYHPLRFILVGIVILAGCLTQYYFIIYAFFSCLACGIVLLRKKHFRYAAAFALCSIMGVVLFFVIWPNIFVHLFAYSGTVSGEGVVRNFVNIFDWSRRIAKFGWLTFRGMPVAVLLLTVFLALLLIFKFKHSNVDHKGKFLSNPEIKQGSERALALILPALMTWIILALISPYYNVRYVFNIMPMIAIAVVSLIQIAIPIIKSNSLQSSIKTKIRFPFFLVFGGLAVTFTLCSTLIIEPDYLYKQFSAYDDSISEYTDSPCVYYSDNKNPAITSDVLQLQQFTDVHITDSVGTVCPSLETYLSEKGNFKYLVVYIDIHHLSSAYNASEVLPELATYVDASSAKLLYTGDFSQAWLLSRDDA